MECDRDTSNMFVLKVFVMAKFDFVSKQVTQEHMIVMYNLFQQRAFMQSCLHCDCLQMSKMGAML